MFMKKCLVCLLLFCCVAFITACSTSNNIVRIHIRANSNSNYDQEIKLQIRDDVVEYITPLISECSDSDDVKKVLSNHLDDIKSVIDRKLHTLNCEYMSSVELNNEFFPSRMYDGISFPADYYDALIVRLGSGTGDNWWCVAYPPLCFVDNDGSESVEYKSILLELIKKFGGDI